MFACWIFLTLLAGGAATCPHCANFQLTAPAGFKTVTYQSSGDHIENPGRGFYHAIGTRASRFHPMTIHSLDAVRRDHGVNLGLRIYILDDFVTSAISSSFLQKIRHDLDIARSAGWSIVLRFHYTDHLASSSPYGDANKRWILEHIRQLQPIWRDYEGVLSAIQAGFIGTWGEWSYSTYFGDSRHPDPHGVQGLTPQNWQDRRDILQAIIDHSPNTIHVQVRTPLFKTEIWGTKTPTRLYDEKHHTNVGRTGHHNDCFLASYNDVGTYHHAEERTYLSRDTLYVPMGGETCRISHVTNGSRRSDCPTALKELAGYHWSFLNLDYHRGVLDRWRSQGCFDQVHRDLGYRLVLNKAFLPSTVTRGGTLCFHIQISSKGFAAPYKAWILRLVLKNKLSGQFYSAMIPEVDARSWIPGMDHIIDGGVTLPTSIQEGTYQMYLVMFPEKMASHSDFYILLDNTGVPGVITGFNDLKSDIQVTGSGHDHSTSRDCPLLRHWTPPSQSRYSRVYGKTPTHHGKCQAIAVPNHSFEDSSDLSWGQYLGGYTFSTTDHHTGQHAILVTSGGASFAFEFTSPVHKFTMTAYSKRQGTSSGSASGYSVYCDLVETGGSLDYGKVSAFDQTNHSWQRAELHVYNVKGITKARCYLLYRNFADGSALFDDVTFTVVADNADFTDC